MDAEKEMVVEESDSDNEEIFFGPITKREITLKLKHYNLCSDELLEPLQKFQDSDILDDNIIKFYYEDAFPKGSNNEKNSWKSKYTDSSAIVSNNLNAENSFNNVESTTSTGLYKDSFDLSDRNSLSESQLLLKYAASHILFESYQFKLDSTNYKSDLENEEPLNKLEQIYNDSLIIQHLSLENKEFISLNSTPENSVSVSINSTPQKSKCTSSKCETVSLNSAVEISKSISFNSTPQKSKSVFVINSTPENSDYSYSNTNEHSGFNCTLEEMEMLMKFGENYMNESKDRSLSIKGDSEGSQTEYEKENYLPLAQNYSIQKSPNVIKRNGQSPTTGNRNENNKFIPKQLHMNTPKQYCNESPFKLPTRTLSKKSPGYKNIVSPVAMYIKSTPKVPFVQNVAKKTVHASTFRETHNLMEECMSETVPKVRATPMLPIRSYRPAARNVLLSREPEPALPGSLRRLIRGPLLPEVIRHVGRMAVLPDDDDDDIIDTPPAQEDLTLLSSSVVQGDVSVYISTNAARTNQLQHT